MTLSFELQKLPPQALDVIRFLREYEQGVEVDTILAGTGLSERTFGKSIRRLVTRYYVTMPSQNFYMLTSVGREAAEELLAYDGSAPAVAYPAPAAEEEQFAETTDAQAPTAPPAASEEICHPRRLSLLVAHELTMALKSVMLVGFDAPQRDAPPLPAPVQLMLRMNAPGCNVEPVERQIELAANGASGPVQFRVQPRLEGVIRIKIEVFEYYGTFDVRPIGGIFFDIDAVPFPTPLSAEFRALGAKIEVPIHQ